LVPKEYTKVDSVIDLVFSTAKDIKEDQLEEAEEEAKEETENKKKKKDSKKVIPVSFHQECIQKVEKHLGVTFIKETRTIFKSIDDKVAISCSVSKKHQKKEKGPIWFWFAFHPHQKERLKNEAEAYLVLGCGSAKLIFLFPIKEFLPWLDRFNKTENENRNYWHLHMGYKNDSYFFWTKKGFKNITLDKYIV